VLISTFFILQSHLLFEFMFESIDNNIIWQIYMYQPIVYKISDAGDIFESDVEAKFSKNIDYPRFSLGFHHFIQQTKDKMPDTTKQFKDKKKVYLVMNPFEVVVDDYDGSILKVGREYFGGSDDIKGRSFFKMWEILIMFDLFDSGKSIVSAHLREGSDMGFVMAVMMFRDKFGSGKADKHYNVVDDGEKGLGIEGVTDIGIGKAGGVKAQLITATSGFKWGYNNTQEQEAFRVILGEIINALRMQIKGGTFVCRIFETFTETVTKLISILAFYYDQVYVVKPFVSRMSSSEKFLVCIGFKDSKNVDILERVLDKLGTKFIVDWFPDYQLPDGLKTTIIQFNRDLANGQFIMLNQMVMFIKKQNYRGEEYIRKRAEQIDANKWWISTFLLSPKDFKTKRKIIMDLVDMSISTNEKKVHNLLELLDFS